VGTSIDQQFVEFVVKSLVSKPDSVSVTRRIDEKGVLLELTVDPEDLGRVIGKRGATAQSIRTLLRALGTKNDARYNLKIVDNGPDKETRSSDKPSDEGQKSEGAWGRDEDNTSSPNTDDKTAESPETEEVAKGEDESPKEEEKEEDSFSRTRKELADLDDLDV
jgi:predicted RNA-binding protein YlqC (UPF0109 family)